MDWKQIQSRTKESGNCICYRVVKYKKEQAKVGDRYKNHSKYWFEKGCNCMFK